MSLVVIGTGTEIGKTITSAILLTRYSGHCNPGYWKPIATGSAEGKDTDVIRSLCGNSVEVLEEQYLFTPPVSPHLISEPETDRVSFRCTPLRYSGRPF